MDSLEIKSGLNPSSDSSKDKAEYTTEEVLAFVNDGLDVSLAGTWTSINDKPFVYAITEDFSIFVRERPFASLPISNYGDFSRYESLRRIRDVESRLVIAYDSEWMYPDPSDPFLRQILSWQFAFLKDGNLVDLVFLTKKKDLRLKLPDALSVICSYYDENAFENSIDMRDVRTYEAAVKAGDMSYQTMSFDSYKEATRVSERIKKIDKIDPKECLGICLLMHAGLVDITSFDHKGLRPILKQLASVQKGLVSVRDILIPCRLLESNHQKHKRVYPFSVAVRDTMTQAPVGFKSLDALGKSIGYPKIMLDPDSKKNKSLKKRMGDVLVSTPLLYMDYAANDADVTLLYVACLYGEDKLPRITITSAAGAVMKKTLSEYLGISPLAKKKFEHFYRGLKTVKKGLSANESELGYIGNLDLEPINYDTHKVQYLASLSYKGGYNGCGEVGYFYNESVPYNDMDICSAYPSAAVCVPQIDWDEPILRTFQDTTLKQIGDELFQDGNPLPLMFAYIDNFTFPENTAFPVFPVMMDGVPVYPLTYDSKSESASEAPRVAVSGPELFLAYKLGGDAVIKEAYLLRPQMIEEENDDGSTVVKPAYALAAGVKQLVSDRAIAKAYAKEHKIEDYLSDKILKTMVNACYGLVSENIRGNIKGDKISGKKKWSALHEEMEEATPSPITNPVSASLITAIVRCTLIAAQNEITAKGYKVFSVTTDGFISDISLEELKKLHLFGFADLLSKSRMFLTDNTNGDIFERKHWMNELLNFCTRGNVSLNPKGVCAHNSCKPPEETEDKKEIVKNSFEDRLWLMKAVLSRTGKIAYKDTVWTTLKDIILGIKPDFGVQEVTKYKSMDFDMKRKPLKSSFYTVYPEIVYTETEDGKSKEVTFKSEIANFSTVPFHDIEEYVRCRKLLKSIIGKSDSKNCSSSTTRRRRSRTNFRSTMNSRSAPRVSKALRTMDDWDEFFFKKLEKKSCSRRGRRSNRQRKDPAKRQRKTILRKREYSVRGDDKAARQIRCCLYAYRAGVISIPLIDEYSVRTFFEALNESGLTRVHFDPKNYKNFGRRERWPDELTSTDKAVVDKFLSQQEPILTQICSLKLPEEGCQE